MANDKTIQVGGDHEEVVLGNVSIAVGSNKLTEYLLSRTQMIFGQFADMASRLRLPDPFNMMEGNYQLFIEKGKSEIVHGGSSEVVAVAKTTVVGTLYQITVGKSKQLIVRDSYDEDIGNTRTIYVGQDMTFRVGENTMFTMSKDGDVVIQGKQIYLKADKIHLN